MSSKSLFIYMNGVLIGHLTRLAFEKLQFTYDSSWLAKEKARPISLSLPLTETPYRSDAVTYFFDNLLPDSEVIRKRIQIEFHVPTTRCFDLLSYIGHDCVGALQLLSSPLTEGEDIHKVKGKKLNDQDIAKLLSDYKTSPLGMNKSNDFRISLAGTQEKTALLWHKNAWYLPRGTTATSHIFKLPIGHIAHAGIDLHDSIENEWLCLQLLSAFGLPVNYARIMHFQDVKTLAVERFDRAWSKKPSWLMRLPQEDMCQALGKSSAFKYEADGGSSIMDIMNVLRGADSAKENRHQFMKSLFLFWILGAIDGHTKNFSIFIKEHGAYQLTPLYDVISAYPLTARHQLEWQNLKMAMALHGKNKHYHWSTIQARHWLDTAKLCQFPQQEMYKIAEQICDQLEDAIDKVTAIFPNNFPTGMANAIFSGMRKARNKWLGPSHK